MRKISDIYREYKIMPNLQEHMFRVAAVASMICDNYNEPLQKEEIITACLLHDMGNIIKARFSSFPEEFYRPKGVEYWKSVKEEYVKKYGAEEHKATIQIIKELGLSDIVSIAEKVDFLQFCNHSKSGDISTKIVICADTRVTPYGIASYEERMEEGRKRYKNHNSTFGAASEEEREKLIVCGKEIEKQIFAKCKIKPEDINDASAAPIIAELKNFMIK